MALGESLDKINTVFHVYEVKKMGDAIKFYGDPLTDGITIYKTLWDDFAQNGSNLELRREYGEFVLIATPFKHEKDNISINIILVVLTAFTTMISGAFFFYNVNPIANPFLIYRGLPFTIAIMFVLGSHELAHYLTARRRGIKASLPFFIPLPFISPIGTLGAVIKLRGAIPDRKSLFDVGVSGPIVGLLASVLVTVVGLTLPPVTITHSGEPTMIISVPILFQLIERVVPTTSGTMHPVAFAGWVGMLVTSLNLLPVGQLDGGHIARALSGDKGKYVSSLVPPLMFLSGLYYSMRGFNGQMLLFWGLFALLFSVGGHAQPINDTAKLDSKRVLLGVIAFILCLACFTPLPLQA